MHMHPLSMKLVLGWNLCFWMVMHDCKVTGLRITGDTSTYTTCDKNKNIGISSWHFSMMFWVCLDKFQTCRGTVYGSHPLSWSPKSSREKGHINPRSTHDSLAISFWDFMYISIPLLQTYTPVNAKKQQGRVVDVVYHPFLYDWFRICTKQWCTRITSSTRKCWMWTGNALWWKGTDVCALCHKQILVWGARWGV